MPTALLCGAAVMLMQIPQMPLKRAINEAILPILQNLSLSHGNSSWSFAYRDDNTSVQLCAGYSNVELRTPCSISDPYAWGSTTKTMTALLILRLVEQGKIKSLDESLVAHANDYLRKISGGQQDLISLFGREIEAVTLRHLLQMTSGIPEYDSNGVREYQNEHRDEDLSPLWVLNRTGKKFSFPPGTSGQYSSTNYVLLGLVAAAHQEAADWDKLDQREWMRGTPADPTSYPSLSASFPTVRYATHSECRNFTTATGMAGRTIHGYQRASFHRKIPPDESDVFNMSCLQGWTCGNMVAQPIDIAEFFWQLLGKKTLLRGSLLSEMLTFREEMYLHSAGVSGYGLGVMNFTSMVPWGFAEEGLFYGHNGLTYGFGAQSGYNYDLGFAVTWINNVEDWMGPDMHGAPYPLYRTLASAVRNFRS